MHTIRPAAVAGLFYPADAAQLQAALAKMLSGAPEANLTPKGLIVPHAGYIYSGRIAAAGYRQLQPLSKQITRVVLLGPAHRLGFSGMAIPESDYFETPLGLVEISAELRHNASTLPGVIAHESAHEKEHSLEVQLPFLQYLLPSFSCLPVLVGQTNKEQVARLLALLWGGRETLILISTDLSHYQDYQSAQQQDEATCVAIEQLRSDLRPEQACGAAPLNGLLLLLEQLELGLTRLALLNSGDTAGDKRRVVGYAAFAIGAESAHAKNRRVH